MGEGSKGSSTGVGEAGEGREQARRRGGREIGEGNGKGRGVSEGP